MAVVLDWERLMTLGLAERQGDLLDDVIRFCDDVVPRSSVYALLHRERDALFPDEFFADLFSDRGCRSAWRGCRIAKRWSITPSMPAGATRLASAATTAEAGAGSPTRCWSTCGPGSPRRAIPSGSSGCPKRRHRRPAWSARSGCWTPRRCTTRWRRWTPSR